MTSPVELAAETYISVWGERDPARRAELIEACFAVDGRLVTRSRDIVGRAELARVVERVLADPKFLRIKLTSVIDASRTTFRVRGVAEHKDGTVSTESFDAGEIDDTGRIKVVLTFAGPLAEAEH